jgi:hypothetical protein
MRPNQSSVFVRARTPGRRGFLLVTTDRPSLCQTQPVASAGRRQTPVTRLASDNEPEVVTAQMTFGLRRER